MLIPDRIDTDELLDKTDVDLREAAESFDDLHTINRFLGGAGVYKKTLFRILRTYPRTRHLSILDVGAGSGDMSADILKRCRSHINSVTLTGLDVQHKFLRLVRQRQAPVNNIDLVASDAMTMPFIDNSFDVVISNLVLHHFYDTADELLCEMYRVARHAVVVNDILRHRMPLLFFKIFSPLFVDSPITQYDGEVSLRRAFSFAEIRRLLHGTDYTDYYFVKHWSFRFGLVIWKKRW